LTIGQANTATLVPFALLACLFMQTYLAPLFALPMQVGGIAAVGAVNGMAKPAGQPRRHRPQLWPGRLRDATGSFEVGLRTLAIMCAFAAATLLAALAGHLPPRERADVRV